MGVLSNNYAQIVPGALISASYVSDIYEVLMGSEPEALKVTGSLTITGSIVSTAGVTSSLQGTSSFAVTASRAISSLTASYAVSASYINYINSSSQADTSVTASYAFYTVSSSYSDFSVLSTSASYSLNSDNAVSSSYSVNSLTSSTSSYVATYINTASISESVLTFTKGNGSQFNITIPGGSGNIGYSSVYFIDPLLGNDGTGVSGSFTKPYATYNGVSASIAANGYTLDQTLIYFRSGLYTSTCNLIDRVQIYCEPGVLFTAGGFTDNGASVSSSVFGYANFNGNCNPIASTGASYITFEFDKCTTYHAQGAIYVGNSTKQLTVTCNELYNSGENKTSVIYLYGSSTDARVNINVKRRIRSFYSMLNVYSNNCVTTINCPEIVLLDGGPFGNASNTKVLITQQWSIYGNITINGNIRSELSAPVYHLLDGLVTFWWGTQHNLTINGNIDAGYSKAIYMSQNGTYWTTGTCTINGNIRGWERIALIGNSAKLNIKNSTIYYSGSTVPLDIQSSAQLFMHNLSINSTSTSNIIYMAAANSRLFANNVTAQGTGSNCFVSGSSSNPKIGLINVTSNLNTSSNVSNVYTSTSFIYEPNLITPNYF